MSTYTKVLKRSSLTKETELGSKRFKTTGEEAPNFKLRNLSNDRPRQTNDEIHSSIDLCPVTTAILDTPPMQRLRGLKQLGTAELVYNNTNHNRFEHSLGVAHLAAKMCRQIRDRQPGLQCTEKDILCVKLAGLLHDIGHGPFSHTYEHFAKEAMPAFLEKHPDLQRLYERFPSLEKGWRHEKVSLMMIDEVLEHLGLQIDREDLDAPLKQVSDGVANTSLRVFQQFPTEHVCTCCSSCVCSKSNEGDGDILTSRDWIFIKECVWGGPLMEGHGFEGRDDTKEWLYDIVSNRHSGLDVDKIDYYARDERRACEHRQSMEKIVIEAVVAYGQCTDPNRCFRCKQPGATGRHLMICYPEKMVKAAMDFFKKRFFLHSTIYRHKTTAAVSFMIHDILCHADPYFLVPTSSMGGPGKRTGKKKSGFDELPISRAMLDPSSFLRVRDSIIDQIACTTVPDLEDARQLIYRLWSRNIYKCASSKTLRMHDAVERGIWEKSEEQIKEEMLSLRGWHGGAGEEQVKVSLDDIIVERCSIDHGSKARNPLNRMRFVQRTDLSKLAGPICNLPDAGVVEEAQYEALLPRIFQENSIRIFCRKPEQVGLVAHLFEQWWENIPRMTNLEDEKGDDTSNADFPVMMTQDSDDEDGYDCGDDSAFQANRSPVASLRRSLGTPHITPPRFHGDV